MRHFFSRTAASTSLRRGLVAATTTALAASTVLSTAPANAAVRGGGGQNADGTPVFVRDSDGLAVSLCTDAVFCEPAVSPHIGSYFSAEATLGPLDAMWGIEAEFLEDAAGNVTTRAAVGNSALFRAEGLRPNRRYTIRGPWGSHTCLTNGEGELNNKNCLFERGGEAGGPLRSGPVKSLLRSRFPVRGFLGADVPQRVSGSPTGFNRVTLTGPGASFRTSLFTITGQLAADTPMSLVSRTSMRLGSRRSAAPVTKIVRYRSVGTAAATPRIRKGGEHPGAFSVDHSCGTVAPGTRCAIEVTYRPVPNRDKTAILTITDNTMAAPRQVVLTGIAPRR